MKEQPYYFSHDSTAKDDPKCLFLIESLGLEGYGIFWVLVETLRLQSDFKYPIKLLPALARRYNTTSDKMAAVVTHFGLFEIEDDMFFSLSLIHRMEMYEIKKLKQSEGGKKAMAKRWQSDKSLISNLYVSDKQDITIKENKIKEKNIEEKEYCSEVNKLTSKPTLMEQDIAYRFKTRRTYKDISEGHEYILTYTELTQLQNTYDYVDVERELKKMQLWVISNPSKRKTASGMPKFINTWLNKLQTTKEIKNEQNNQHRYGAKPNGFIEYTEYKLS